MLRGCCEETASVEFKLYQQLVANHSMSRTTSSHVAYIAYWVKLSKPVLYSATEFESLTNTHIGHPI